jgi:DNA replication protein DnaC
LREVPNAQVMRMSRISRWLRRCEGPDDEIEVIKQLSEMTMLLDDLGSEKMTDFLQSNFYEIIDRRLEYRINGLIITSNLSLDQLAPIIGDRTVSRIMGLVGRKNILEFSGKDYRWETK